MFPYFVCDAEARAAQICQTCLLCHPWSILLFLAYVQFNNAVLLASVSNQCRKKDACTYIISLVLNINPWAYLDNLALAGLCTWYSSPHTASQLTFQYRDVLSSLPNPMSAWRVCCITPTRLLNPIHCGSMHCLSRETFVSCFHLRRRTRVLRLSLWY